MAWSVLALLLVGASAQTLLPPNDPTFYYSPYGWSVNGTSATTMNTGSYFKILFTGSSLNLTFDTSLMVDIPSQLYITIDNGPKIHTLVLPNVYVEVPVNNTRGDVPFHYLEVIVKSMTETRNRWATGVPSTRVKFTGLILESGANTSNVIPSNLNILIYGDSITEGVLTLGGSQQYDTDHNDATVCYSYRLAGLLGGEIGVVGFGATGLSRGGSGGVPPLGVSWNQLWDGMPRSFLPKPDIILFNEGTNDGAAPIAPRMTEVLNNVSAACPGTPIAVLLPFNGAERANLLAAVTATGNPLVHFVDTAGFYNQQFGGGLHPTGPNDMAKIAPQIANAVRAIMMKSVSISRLGDEVTEDEYSLLSSSPPPASK